jgi:rod shape determining protein RodA
MKISSVFAKDGLKNSIAKLFSRETLAVIALMFISVLALYSAADGSFKPWAQKQILFFITGLFLIIFLVAVDINVIYKASYFIFFLSLIFLVIALFFGNSAKGATRWIDLKILKFQPSEFAKLGTILFFARYMNDLSPFLKRKISYVLIIPAILSIPVFILVAIQPDLATSLIILSIIFSAFFFINVNMKFFVFIIVSSLAAMPIIWQFFLKKYQKMRILNFLNPELDPLGSGYNIIQSKIAIGSGGLLGKGFLNGTQGKLRFLPERQTDFIFTIISEEFGFIGFMALMLCYMVILRYGYYVALKSKNTFGKMVAMLSSILIFLHIIVNIGMTSGLFPVAGIPLPLISYGGTMSILFCILFALIRVVDINRDVKLR